MATRISLAKGGGSLGTSAAFQKKVTRATAPKVATVMARRMQRDAKAGYKNAVTQVERTLLNPKMTGLGGGSQQVYYKDHTGARGWFKTSKFAALARKYARRRPASSTFWQKRGILSAVFSAAVSPGLASASVRTDRIAYGKVPRVYQSLTFTRLPEPMDTYIRRRFMDGLAGKDVRRSGNVGVDTATRDSLGKFVFPESNRPFISQMASTLGRKLRIMLRSGG